MTSHQASKVRELDELLRTIVTAVLQESVLSGALTDEMRLRDSQAVLKKIATALFYAGHTAFIRGVFFDQDSNGDPAHLSTLTLEQVHAHIDTLDIAREILIVFDDIYYT